MGRREFFIRRNAEFELEQRIALQRKIDASKTPTQSKTPPRDISGLIAKADHTVLRMMLDAETLTKLGIDPGKR